MTPDEAVEILVRYIPRRGGLSAEGDVALRVLLRYIRRAESLEQAEAEVERLQGRLDDIRAGYEQQQGHAEHKALEAENKRLREALDLYGEHLHSCPVKQYPPESKPECTCGLRAALSPEVK